jgi:SAM-dependent methyltransferase
MGMIHLRCRFRRPLAQADARGFGRLQVVYCMIFDYSRLSKRQTVLFWLWRWVSQLWDPLYSVAGLRELPHFFTSWKAYSRLGGAERIRVADIYPQLHDRTPTHFSNAHYFYVNAWAMRRIIAAAPATHLDVASQPVLSSLLSALLPVTFLDYRPLQVTLDGLSCVGGDILALPYEDRTIASISCLHVAEHIGLGRYGDPLDPKGTRAAARELARVLAPGGNIFFALPVGKPRLCFNAHRIHSATAILDYFSDLTLIEFSAVRDDGSFVERINPADCNDSAYACGMFWFKRRGTDAQSSPSV